MPTKVAIGCVWAVGLLVLLAVLGSRREETYIAQRSVNLVSARNFIVFLFFVDFEFFMITSLKQQVT